MGKIKSRMSRWEIKLDNNQVKWVSRQNLITKVLSKSCLICDVQGRDNYKVVESIKIIQK